MTDRKISDEQLEKEIQKGKNQKEIAIEYGYAYPSGHLSDRCRELGYRKLNKLNIMPSGNASLSLTNTQVQMVKEAKGLEENQQLFFEREVKSNGDILLKFSDEEWHRE